MRADSAPAMLAAESEEPRAKAAAAASERSAALLAMPAVVHDVGAADAAVPDGELLYRRSGPVPQLPAGSSEKAVALHSPEAAVAPAAWTQGQPVCAAAHEAFP